MSSTCNIDKTIYKKILTGSNFLIETIQQFTNEINIGRTKSPREIDEYWIDIIIKEVLYWHISLNPEAYFGRVSDAIRTNCFSKFKIVYSIAELVGVSSGSHVIHLTVSRHEEESVKPFLSDSEVLEANKTSSVCVRCGNPTVQKALFSSVIGYCPGCSG